MFVYTKWTSRVMKLLFVFPLFVSFYNW